MDYREKESKLNKTKRLAAGRYRHVEFISEFSRFQLMAFGVTGFREMAQGIIGEQVE